MRDSGRVTVDPEALAAGGAALEESFEKTRSLLASTLRAARQAAGSIRGAPAEPWAALLEDWEAQAARHAEQGERLSGGLTFAARAYSAADVLNADAFESGGSGELLDAPRAATAALAPTAAAQTDPSPTDSVSTPYGELGQWMIQSNGQVADWLGQKNLGKTMYEPINVVLVDKISTTPQEAVARLNKEFAAAGFPAQGVHSTGYQGLVDGRLYGEQPTGSGEAYSDGFYLLPNDHGRVFGPAPAMGGGYVWTAALSREQLGFNGSVIPTHVYASFDVARDNLRAALLDHGATDLGTIPMGNVRDTATATTGDHDGNAVVVRLN